MFNWLKYQKSDGYVVAIYQAETAPKVEEEYGVIQHELFRPGDEFTYYIVVHLDSEGNPTNQFSAIQQSPPATYILQSIADKESRIFDLETGIAAILGGAY